MRAVAALMLLLFCGCENLIQPPEPAPNVKSTVLAFEASWCGPCQRNKPALAALAQRYSITHIDIDSRRDLASQYGITAVPTYVVMKLGKEIGRSNDIDTLKRLLAQP